MTPSADMRELDADSSETTAPRLPPRDALQNTHAVFSDMPSVPAVENPRQLEIAMYWGDTRMSVLVLDTPRPVTVGYGIVDFPAFLPTGIERYVIADVSGEDTFFEVGRGMEVEIRGEDEMPLDIKRLVKLGRAPTSALDGRGTRLKLEKRERIAIALGDMVFAARWVPKQLPLGPLVKLDKHFAAALGATVIAHIFALAVMLSTPYTDPELPIEMLENPTRTAKLVLEERAKKPIPIVRENAAAAQGGKAHGDEGAAGRPSDTPRETAPSGKGVPVPSKRERDRQVARRSGLLQVLGQGRDNATASVFNPGGLGSGIDDALGGLKANARGESGGVGGAGGKGTNLGGGGKSSLGIGGVGSGSGVGQGLASVGLSGRGRATEVIPGRTVIKGCLAQEVVGRVVSRHNSQVKYCYEKELQRKPDLSGKVVAAFTIGSGGDVTETRVSESTIDDAAVEQCLMRVVTHMKFPPCEGGGTAEVTYPWLFKAGGE
ncbi:MAG: energy transducer TonB [Clostridia bacterium]|nr:energy transducer TonB [Deltaproteobacteria bacterium]